MLTNEQLAQLEARLLARLHGEDGDLAVLMDHVAQLTALVNGVMGYDKPQLFEGWSQSDKEHYAQMSPVEIFNAWRRNQCELEQAYIVIAVLADQLRDCSGYAHNLNYKLNTPKHVRPIEWRDCQDGYCAAVKSCLAEHETIIKRAEQHEREHKDNVD